ncbi:hypothetical protein WJX74_002056 [Apatococcus lobatus]|uniref:Uncharacterized protein n=2 Tax=Apatococcus TaxID=904362 RepID=A0AAW1T383_9CHLO
MSLQLPRPGSLLPEIARHTHRNPGYTAGSWARQARLQRTVRSISEPLEFAVEKPAQNQPASPTFPQSLTEQVLSSGTVEGDPRKALKTCEAYWTALRKAPPRRPPAVIRNRHKTLGLATDFDVCVCGGTLGLFIGLALQLQGHRVAIIERNALRGRNQEWNISRQELQELVTLGLVTEAELKAAIVTEFNPVRVAIHGGTECFTTDCLNIGVRPKTLIRSMRARFEEAGGTVMEHTAFRTADLYRDAVVIQTASQAGSAPAAAPEDAQPSGAYHGLDAQDDAAGETTDASQSRHENGANGRAAPSPVQQSTHEQGPAVSQSSSPSPAASKAEERQTWRERARQKQRAKLTKPGDVSCRLIVDCMGHWSSIAAQARKGRKPHGVALVVGGMAEGFPEEANQSGDVLATITDAEDDMQLFWEALPAEGAGNAKTTYAFAYCDSDKSRPDLATLLERYFELLPQYQGVPLEQLTFRRVLFAGFPCYADGPLRPAFPRIIQVGDAGAAQSPLSFGGFASMVRHLPRLSAGINQALRKDALDERGLGLLQPYQPSLAAAWLFQRSMALRVGQLQQARGEGRRRHVSGWVPPGHINRILSCTFRVMQTFGDSMLRPFLQDTIRWWPLTATMAGMLLIDPIAVFRVVPQVGPRVFLNWFRHYFALTMYAALRVISPPLRSLKGVYWLQRWIDAWTWGSGHSTSLAAS